MEIFFKKLQDADSFKTFKVFSFFFWKIAEDFIHTSIDLFRLANGDCWVDIFFTIIAIIATKTNFLQNLSIVIRHFLHLLL